MSKSKTTSPNFGTFGHLDVVPMESHKVYYKEGNGASSKRLRAVQNLCFLCFRLSLLSVEPLAFNLH
jgi:hypothetical protein